MGVRLTLNGQELTVDGAPTILELAKRQRIDIPTLCSYDGYANGVCRLCMVEVDGGGRAVPACSTRVREGMSIRTDTPRLQDLRRGLLSLLVGEHGRHAGSDPCSPRAARGGFRRERPNGARWNRHRRRLASRHPVRPVPLHPVPQVPDRLR